MGCPRSIGGRRVYGYGRDQKANYGKSSIPNAVLQVPSLLEREPNTMAASIPLAGNLELVRQTRRGPDDDSMTGLHQFVIELRQFWSGADAPTKGWVLLSDPAGLLPGRER